MHILATDIYTPFLQLKKTTIVPRRLVTIKQNKTACLKYAYH